MGKNKLKNKRVLGKSNLGNKNNRLKKKRLKNLKKIASQTINRMETEKSNLKIDLKVSKIYLDLL